jgi:hypothetical protein
MYTFLVCVFLLSMSFWVHNKFLYYVHLKNLRIPGGGSKHKCFSFKKFGDTYHRRSSPPPFETAYCNFKNCNETQETILCVQYCEAGSRGSLWGPQWVQGGGTLCGRESGGHFEASSRTRASPGGEASPRSSWILAICIGLQTYFHRSHFYYISVILNGIKFIKWRKMYKFLDSNISSLFQNMVSLNVSFFCPFFYF